MNLEHKYYIDKCIDYSCALLCEVNFITEGDIKEKIIEKHNDFKKYLDDNGYESSILKKAIIHPNEIQYYEIRVNENFFNSPSEEIFNKAYTILEIRTINRNNTIDKLID